MHYGLKKCKLLYDDSTDKKELVCKRCSKEFRTKLHFNVHLQFECNDFLCEACNKNFNNKETFKKHRKSCKVGQFPCSFCNKLLPTENRLRRHIVRECGVKEFPCKHCPKQFKWNNQRLKHTFDAHIDKVEDEKKQEKKDDPVKNNENFDDLLPSAQREAVSNPPMPVALVCNLQHTEQMPKLISLQKVNLDSD